MDPRISEHAEVIADHSLDLQSGDMLVIQLPPAAEELAVALHEVAGDRGAEPVYLNNSPRARRAFQRATDEFREPTHRTALYEAADKFVISRGGANAREATDVTPETTAAFRRTYQDAREARLDSTWCLTQFPVASQAQLAGMSTEAYETFVWDAVTLDWDEQAAFQSPLVEMLDDASEVRIQSGETDVSMSVAGNHAINDTGKANLPGGEVFTAPVRESVEGVVHFDLPLYYQDREVTDVRLRFDNGRVVSYEAAQNETVLDGLFETDDGARYLGELGIGMNRAIDRFSYNMLFDEKMGDTVHMAVGSAYPATVGEENVENDSAEHVDMLVDMSEESVIEIDGEVVQRNGTFVFEDDFE